MTLVNVMIRLCYGSQLDRDQHYGLEVDALSVAVAAVAAVAASAAGSSLRRQDEWRGVVNRTSQGRKGWVA